MNDFPTIRQMLRTCFNAEDGLSESVSTRLYVGNAASDSIRARLLAELREALSRDDVSWRSMLCNEDYEAADIETEEAARTYARTILWSPLFNNAPVAQLRD